MLSEDDCEKEAWRARVDAFLRKPKGVDKVASTIDRVLKDRQKKNVGQGQNVIRCALEFFNCSMQGSIKSTAQDRQHDFIGRIGSIGRWVLFLFSIIGIAMTLLLMLGLIGYAGGYADVPRNLPAIAVFIFLPFVPPLVYLFLSVYATLRIKRKRTLVSLAILLNFPVLTLMIWSMVENREVNSFGIVCLAYLISWAAFVCGRATRSDSLDVVKE